MSTVVNKPAHQKTAEERAKTPCYIARHSCGLIVAAMVDDGTRPNDVAAEVASWIRAGDTIERCKVEDVRAGDWCTCFDPKPPDSAEQGT